MFNPPLLNKLPLKYRCAANKLKYKSSLFIFNFIEVYFSNYFIDKKPTILSDHHIVGNNPIINMLLLYFIGIDAKQKNDKTTITLSCPSTYDYWSYSLSNDKSLYDILSNILGEKISTYEEFLKFITRKIPLDKIVIYYQESEIEWSRYDHYIREFLFSFNQNKNTDNSALSQDISNHIIHENKIRNDLMKISLEHLRKFDLVKSICNPLPEKGLKVFSPISHITSLPQGWLNIRTLQKNEDDNIILLEHHFSKMNSSYASASRLCTHSFEMKNLSIQQILELKDIFKKNKSLNNPIKQ